MDQEVSKQPLDPPLFSGKSKPAFWSLPSLPAGEEKMPSALDTAGKSLNTESPGVVLGEGAICHLKGAPPSPCDEISFEALFLHLLLQGHQEAPISSLSFSTPAAPRDLESGCDLASITLF